MTPREYLKFVGSMKGLKGKELETQVEDAMEKTDLTEEYADRLIKNLSKGIKLVIKDDKVSIDLYINIRYGYSIPKITAQIQDRVKNAIESMTGLTTANVTIHIVDIEVK